jgi:hypothetical protein
MWNRFQLLEYDPAPERFNSPEGLASGDIFPSERRQSMNARKKFLAAALACALALVGFWARQAAAQSGGAAQPQKPLSSDNWSYPDSLDAPVASPEQYKVLYDDAAVRLLEVTVAPGQKEKMHADRWPAVLVLDTPATKIRRQGNDGAARELNPANDKPLNGPLPIVVRVPPAAPHADENIDTHARHYYRVEFKQLKFALYDIPNGPYWADTGLQVPVGDPSYPKQVVEDPTPQFADPDRWPFPFSMDATVASPGQHILRYQDANIRFVEVLGHPFDREGMHDHRYPTVFINDTIGPKVVDKHYDGTVVVNLPSGNPLNGGPFPQMSLHSPDLPHSGMNIDDHDGHFYRVEFKKFRFQAYDTRKGRVLVNSNNNVDPGILVNANMPADVRR